MLLYVSMEFVGVDLPCLPADDALSSICRVLGHAKTILVLMGSWLFLGETASTKKLFGMVLAVAGMVLYGKASMAQAPAPPPTVLMTKQPSGPDAEEGEPLVMGAAGNAKEGVLGSGPISRH